MPHGNMKRAAELTLCLLAAVHPLKQMLTRINYIRSEEKSRFHVDTIQAILAVKTNIDLSYEAIRKNTWIKSWRKYILQINTMLSQRPPFQSNQGADNNCLTHYIIIVTCRSVNIYWVWSDNWIYCTRTIHNYK
jgi:hypothetical protein